ncbi:MAG: FGGY-family carbohydrate kinase [Oscillospiraceae bacterium]
MYIGLDLGTSGVKAAAIDKYGCVHASCYKGLTMYGLEEGKRELCPQEVIEAAKEVLTDAIAKAGGENIEIITVSSLGEAAIPIGKDGTILMNSIIGSDRRGADALGNIKEQFNEKDITDITGLNLSSIYTLNKLLYLQKEFPDVYAKTEKFLCFEDFAVWWLTGETVIDYSMASRTLAFDINSYSWSDKILNRLNIDSSMFSTPAIAGTIVGELRANISHDLGIARNVKVAIGTHDHICNAIGAGAVTKGVCSNTCGTTEGITTIIGSKKMKSADIISNNISCEPFAQPNIFNTVAWHNTAGAMINWFIKMFYDKPQDIGALLKALDASCSDSPTKLVVHPHFSGATVNSMDENSKGSIFGLTLSTSKQELFKALMEGSTYELRLIISSLNQCSINVNNLVCSGGGSKSDVWMQIKADITGLPIHCVECSDTGAVGAGIISAVALGHYTNIEEAAKVMVKSGKSFEPIEKNNRIYDERFAEYKGIYEKTKSISHIL